MEQRPIKALHNRNPTRLLLVLNRPVHLRLVQLLIQAIHIIRVQPLLDIRAVTRRPVYALVLRRLRVLGGARLAADLGDAEDGLPALEAGLDVRFGGVVAEAGGGQGALCPAAVDAGEVPVDGVGGGVAVELVADVD
jgi:hypothetical protein